MVKNCCVTGCHNRYDSNLSSSVSFFRFPSINTRFSEKLQNLQKKRLEKWITSLNRQNISSTNVKHFRICSKHFISGKPADFRCENDPDWLPTANMGCKVSEPRSNTRLRKYKRTVNREARRKIKVEEIPPTHNSFINESILDEEETGIACQTDLTHDDVTALQKELVQRNNELYELRQQVKQLSWHKESVADDNKMLFYAGIPKLKVIHFMLE